MKARKLFAGHKLRQIRQDNKLTQASIAGQLGISTSYYNQLENNQRHMTASVLLALAEVLSVDITTLSGSESDRLLADLAEAFADPLFAGAQPSSHDIKLVVQNTPAVAHAFLSMHQTLRRTGEQLAELDDTLERSGVAHEPTPYEEVRDYFHYIDNYVDPLDQAAEAFARKLAAGAHDRVRVLADYVEREHRVRVVFGGEATRPDALRHYDVASRLLSLNPRSPVSTHAFQIAHQIARLEHREAIDQIIGSAGFRSPDAADIARIGLANYFAGATVLPYGPFLEEAATARHDIDLLADRFAASDEQIMHRLSSLQRPGNKGVPFFFARVDQAGNITKRHSATRLQFARFGAACPLWNAHRAFETPNRMIRQLAETPDGMRYLCLAIAVQRPSGGFRDPVRHYALALGCDIKHAANLVYGDDLDLERKEAFEPIGVSCRICERRSCHQRAAPPLKRRLRIDGDVRNTIPYSFE